MIYATLMLAYIGKTTTPKPMKAEYIRNGRLRLLGRQAQYRDEVQLVGEDFRKAVTTLSPGDVIFVQYPMRGQHTRVDTPRVKWVSKP